MWSVKQFKNEIPMISLVGLLALSLVFGWVRYGYGLLLPNFEKEFNLSASTLGIISSLSFFSFFIGALLVTIFISKLGPKWFILAGILSGSVGLMVSALAQSGFMFAVGCFISGFSPGLCWSSFSDSVRQNIKESLQKRSLAIISTGSSLGLVGIAAIYLLIDGDGWRYLWGIGGVIGLFIFLWASRTIPPGTLRDSPQYDKSQERSSVINHQSIPLYMASFVFGITEATYWTFSADFVQQTFSINEANAILFLITGIGGLGGLLAGDFINLIGFKKSFIITVVFYALSMLMLFFSQSWLIICLSGFLFGLTFMLYAAFLPIWSAEVFPSAPAKGFSISIMVLNVGTIAGPALFGGILAVMEYKWIFLFMGLIACVKVLWTPRRRQELSAGTTN
ncbi:MFS transporter [Halobacillus yeomjeoni]|uniref:MFS transporter n=1 Tax=Halobacillus yeomjeoni TaxID=311194 RepID=UPI001CD23FBB|nr:MFS transporter [Halobacillus yeomjeoni]MCA0982889.1 MFS transporter [Halobacillus yeomjeoni]